MKRTLLVIAVVIGALIPAAHANRWHGLPEALAWLAPFAFLLSRREFVRRGCQLVLVAGAFVTLDTMIHFIRLRAAMGVPWTRLAVILCVASAVPLLAAWALEHPFFRRQSTAPREPAKPAGIPKGEALWPPEASSTASSVSSAPLTPIAPIPSSTIPSLAASALTFLGLSAVQLKVPSPMLLAERFLPGAGWLEASLLAVYAGFAAGAMLAPGRSPVIRRRIWTLFSVVFFGQLALGLLGFERFLMTGKLHLPVPALIAAGPLFRGDGLFMLILFGVTVLLAGPAWCSHLCYIGAWDSGMAGARKRPAAIPAWVRGARMALAALVMASAWVMGRAGVPALWAVWLAAGFGLAGVAVMVGLSRRHGVMTHCAGWCPMGLFAGLFGKLSPWRLRIREGCTSCGACSMACRYDALRPGDLAARRPGVSCSLCGDCLERCPRKEMELTVFGRGGPAARAAFVSLVVALHAVFLGVARL
ncbi:MAG: 4Fe-4S binding protein [Thermodesulfobacteriota bacterium]